MKVVQKLKHPDKFTKEETYRAMRGAREQWLRDHQPKRPVAKVDSKMMECDPSATLAALDTIAENS